MFDVEFIIAGAGPVGTAAALRLAKLGYSVMVCEVNPDCSQDLRASTFHASTLEMLDELGVVETMIAKGLKSPLYHFRERQSGETIEFDLGELSGEIKFPFRLQCEQHVMASILVDKLEEHENVDVQFNSRVLHFTQDEYGVSVDIETPIEIQHIRAKYLIGADGGSSTVRKWMNVEFEGFTYPERFLCLSTKTELADHIENLANVNYVSDPQEWLVLLRVPSVWRILVPAFEEQSDEYLLSDDKKEQVMQRLVGDPDVKTEHRTIYRVHQRVAKKFNQGRVILVGDAAHLNNPLGGFGMNSGIHDAWNLCEKLETCVERGHDERLLDLYDRQRRTVTHNFIQAQTIKNKDLLEAGSAEAHSKQIAKMREIQADPVLRKAFLLEQAMFKSLEDAQQIT